MSREDFVDDPAKLGAIAEAGKMPADAFRDRYGYLVRSRASVLA